MTTMHPQGIPGGRHLAVSLGMLDFSTDGQEWQSHAAVIGLRAYEGWGPVADATETFQHPSGDGTYSGMRRRSGRTVTLYGDVRGKTPAATLEAWDRLEAARGLLVIDERVRMLAREADVRVIDLVPERRSELHLRYTLTLSADDPLRYSTESLDLANGANTLVNDGTADARPVLDVVGPHGEITIVHSRGTWKLAATPSGTTRTVDLRNGTVWQGGVRMHGLVSGPPPRVDAGTTAVWTASGLGSGLLRARRFGAWP